MSVPTIPSSKPGAPGNLTEAADNAPGNPVGLTELSPVTPSSPDNLTELSPATPGNPVGLTQLSPATPGNPANLAEIAKSEPGNPANLTEIAKSEPGNPANLTEIAKSALGNPANLAEVASSGIDRTLTPLFNFNAALGLPDSVTYSRSSSASYIETFEGALGRFQTRLTNDYVGSVENLALYSENFDGAGYNEINITVSATNIKSPNGSQASKITESAGSSTQYRIIQTITTVVSTVYTAKVLMKSISAEWVILNFSVGKVWVNLKTGTIGTITAGTASIRYISNGWYEVTTTGTATLTAINLYVQFAPSNGSETYTTSGGAQFLLSEFQFTASSKPLPYVRTFDVPVTQSFTASPRYEEKGLLVEGGSTNYDSYSQGDGLHNVGSTFGVVTHPTTTENAGITPEGSYTANKLSWTTATERFGTQSGATTQQIPDQTGNATISLYIKFISGDASNLSLTLRQTGTGAIRAARLIGSEITGVNGWVRIKISGTTVSGGGTCGWYLGNATTPVVIQVWAYQLEAKPFATSYIRTEGSTVSRAKDDIIADVSLAGNQASIFCSYSHNTTEVFSSRISYSFNDGGFSNRFIAILNSSNLVNFQASAGGVLQYNLFTSGAGVDGTKTFDTILIANNGNVTTYLDREQINTASLNTFPPNLNTLQLGSNLYGHINRMEVYDLALTANEVKAL